MNIKRDDYINTMKTNEQMQNNVIAFRSNNHKIRTIRNYKIALSSFYYKRMVMNEIDCILFGDKAKTIIKQTLTMVLFLKV